ncbi:MAG TPA: 30S ribosomal protein S13 [Candidatus Paceibacterota bacterium]|nr:30S ribosomal protein S13 [Candidatus Paceibacterota bacterium]
MPRIFGVTIPDKKKILYSLPYLYGIGPASAGLILKTAGIDPAKRAEKLTAEEIGKIQKVIEKTHRIEGDLRKEVAQNQKRYKEIGTWHGNRLARRLPIRGRTKTNSRTTRGNVRRTMGSGRAKAAEKT